MKMKDLEGIPERTMGGCGAEKEPLPPRIGCLLCKGADHDERFDYCRACGRVADPWPYGASAS